MSLYKPAFANCACMLSLCFFHGAAELYAMDEPWLSSQNGRNSGEGESHTSDTKISRRKALRDLRTEEDVLNNNISSSPESRTEDSANIAPFWKRRPSCSPGPRVRSASEAARVERRAAKRKLRETAEEKLDEEYLKFLASVPGFEHARENNYIYSDPAKELKNIIQNNPDLQLREDFSAELLPPGRYAECIETGFTTRQFKSQKYYNCATQGWKIHISAQSNMQKIAALVMAVIDKDIYHANPKNSEIKYSYTLFKIANTLPSMRTINYIIGNLKGDGRETQVGKFITIYPANKKHALALAKSIDEQLLWALRGKILCKDDFYPLMGDALVGESGGVFVRYGNMSLMRDVVRKGNYCESKVINRVPPKRNKGAPQRDINSLEQSHIELVEELVPDDRYHPWPDFMNKNNNSWVEARDPFVGLNMRWISRDKQIITWKNRPNWWACLYN
jgi:hypothetical protein